MNSQGSAGLVLTSICRARSIIRPKKRHEEHDSIVIVPIYLQYLFELARKLNDSAASDGYLKPSTECVGTHKKLL